MSDIFLIAAQAIDNGNPTEAAATFMSKIHCRGKAARAMRFAAYLIHLYGEKQGINYIQQMANALDD